MQGSNRFAQPEIRHVASHQRQMMNFCCRREKYLHCAYRTSRCLAACHHFAPSFCDICVDRQHSALEPQRQFAPQPFLEPAPTRSDRQSFHAIAELCQRDDTWEYPILIRGFRGGLNSTPLPGVPSQHQMLDPTWRPGTVLWFAFFSLQARLPPGARLPRSALDSSRQPTSSWHSG